MKLIRWQRPQLSNSLAFGRWPSLQAEIDRLFDLSFADGPLSGRVLNDWVPALDVYEDKENLFVKAELPGLRTEDIAVSLEDGALTISGERPEEKQDSAQPYRRERFVGKFQRSFTLPVSVEADKVKAAYKDGVLTVTLPKAPEAQPKQIAVKVS